jgi:hypothetical protein
MSNHPRTLHITIALLIVLQLLLAAGLGYYLH